MWCKCFTNHLQPFLNGFQNAKVWRKALIKGEILNFCDLKFQIYCNDILLVKKLNKSIWQNKKLLCLEECRKLDWFYLTNDIFGRYSIIST